MAGDEAAGIALDEPMVTVSSAEAATVVWFPERYSVVPSAEHTPRIIEASPLPYDTVALVSTTPLADKR